MPLQPSDAILAWAAEQPEWRRDALRRILTKRFSAEDDDGCLELLKAAHGIAESRLQPDPLDRAHLPARSAESTNLRLLELGSVANVNRLSEDAALSLSGDGLTMIYGDNGSGKSGFIRLLKKAGRARDHEEILPNVYAEARAAGRASAKFTVADGGQEPTVVEWVDGRPAAEILSRFAIFDSKCANVYIDEENRIEIVPHNLDCFEKLAQLCDRLRTRLKSECDALEAQLALPLPAVPADTAAAKFLANLKQRSESELNDATAWSDKDEARLVELGHILKDPAAEAKRLERIGAALDVHVRSLGAAAGGLSDAEAQKIQLLGKAARDLRAEADASASAAFASEPLKGIGGEPWQLMFEAARVYSEQEAYAGLGYPVLDGEARCVLCQQTLDDQAKARFGRFAQFVTGAVNAKAQAAQAAASEALAAIDALTLPIPEMPAEARDLLSSRDRDLAERARAFAEALSRRRQELVDGRAPAEALPANPAEALKEAAAAVVLAAQEAKALAAAEASAGEALRREHAELSGRKLLHGVRDDLKRRMETYGRVARLQAAIKACATKDISDHGSKLLKTHVTEALAAALAEEQNGLGLSSIPIALSDRTAKAAIKHTLKLKGATLSADTSAVLSEGEHRAVALAAFFAELKMYAGKDAIIIDDPVSSLDHMRRERVAQRLVEEARTRQVVVFTHDLVFLSEARYHAVKAGIPIRVLGIRRGPKGFGSMDPDGEPWLAKHLPARRQWLSQQLAKLRKLHAEASPDYEPQLRYFYDRLRESWERLVEERLFAQVVSRFQPQVQTQRLREAVVDDELYVQVHHGMTAVSSYTGHDRPAGKGGALAEPDECDRHLKDFTDCLDHVDQKSKQAAKARESMLKPDRR